jgi:hypothetical protein
VLLFVLAMTGKPPPPSFTDEYVLSCLRAAAGRGLTHTRQGQADLLAYDWDMEDINELIKACSEDELNRHELSDSYPKFNDYIVVLKVDLEGERRPFYVKVALALPDLSSGELLSFHEWGLIR